MILLLDKVDNDIINIGAGKDYSINEFANMVCKISDVDPKVIKYNTSKYVGAKSKILDNTKLYKLVPDYNQIPIHLIKDGGQQFNDDYAELNPQNFVPT